jgi:hypothetical protein
LLTNSSVSAFSGQLKEALLHLKQKWKSREKALKAGGPVEMDRRAEEEQESRQTSESRMTVESRQTGE